MHDRRQRPFVVVAVPLQRAPAPTRVMSLPEVPSLAELVDAPDVATA
jgi:hypothetical protein